jgi:glycosyltransferase involved in cell wall biosynthesis
MAGMHTKQTAEQPNLLDVQSPILTVLLLLPYAPAAFMQADVEILSRHFNLDVLVHNRGKLRLALGVLRRLLFNRPDLLLMWFIVPSYALPVALLAKLLGVRVAFVTGGYDIVGMPAIGFGALRFPLFRALLRLTLPVADLFLPFSASASTQLRKYGRSRRSRVIYPGVDNGFFTPASNAAEREPLALTVSAINSVSLRQKGLLTFVQAAGYAPQIKWVLVGSPLDDSIEQLREIATPNVEFIDRFVPASELRALYRRASCYVQASIHEGFGIAVAEAMCCGAVPVVTRCWSLPEVAGDLGSYVPLNDPQAVAQAAIASLHAPDSLRRTLRSRIVASYPLDRRERELTDALLALVPGRRRLTPDYTAAPPVKIDLGCGSLQKPGFWGIDLRPTRATILTADAQALPIATSTVDELHASCLLEHFDAPYRVLDEVHRVLKPTGKAVFRLPNLGTYSSHLDTTHRFLADLAIWRSLFEGYFAHVEVQPVGTKYRDSRSLVAVNWLLVNVLKWHELAQGWDFICTQPRPEPTLSYVGWWEESEHSGRIGGQTTSVR